MYKEIVYVLNYRATVKCFYMKNVHNVSYNTRMEIEGEMETSLSIYCGTLIEQIGQMIEIFLQF